MLVLLDKQLSKGRHKHKYDRQGPCLQGARLLALCVHLLRDYKDLSESGFPR